MNKNTENSFKSPVKGIDPVSHGTFIIEYAFMIWDEWETAYGCVEEDNFYQGKIVITSENDNPLYKIAKEQPLRLQGLIASVQFGTEKRFIKIRTISSYNIYPEINGISDIDLNPVAFEILGNLEYLEEIDDYKNQNLL
jgi:hypothetical protein